jgi:hypothetical protein
MSRRPFSQKLDSAVHVVGLRRFEGAAKTRSVRCAFGKTPARMITTPMMYAVVQMAH